VLNLKYSLIVDAYEKIEATTKRLEMTAYLVDLLKHSDPSSIDKVVYLTQGKLYPDYIGVELGMADKLVLRSIALAAGASLSDVEKIYKDKGDVGETAEHALSKMKRQFALTDFFQVQQAGKGELTVEKVYDTLDKIAKATGEGAQEAKIKYLTGLLKEATPREAKYIVRTVTGKLRLGIADMTILDALAIAFAGGKEARPILERAYNLTSDLGFVARKLLAEGLAAVKEVKPEPGRPIRPMLAERLASPEEILTKLGGKAAVEFKYDGERVQAHKIGSNVLLFSRRLENITSHYPDVCEYILKYLKANEAIVEGEIVAVDPDTGDMLPFQELMHRRRKYGIEEAMKMYPVEVKMFDALYLDGEDLTLKPYPYRRQKLSEVIVESEKFKLAEAIIVEKPEDLEKFFEEAIEKGCEGVVVKSVTSDAIYQAGARGWLWIKYKRDYKSEMIDTVDLVAVGAFWGRGKRAGKYGALLLACYDPKEDVFRTVCKCGSGFTDEDLDKMPDMFKPYVIPHKHARVDSQLKPDVWFEPKIVLEVIGAEITLSPTHTCAKDVIRPGSGLAIRFPRFTGRWRVDKSPEDTTTVDEIVEMYKKQLRKIEEVAPA